MGEQKYLLSAMRYAWLQIALFKKRKKAIILRNGYNGPRLCFSLHFSFFLLLPFSKQTSDFEIETKTMFASRIDFSNILARSVLAQTRCTWIFQQNAINHMSAWLCCCCCFFFRSFQVEGRKKNMMKNERNM